MRLLVALTLQNGGPWLDPEIFWPVLKEGMTVRRAGVLVVARNGLVHHGFKIANRSIAVGIDVRPDLEGRMMPRRMVFRGCLKFGMSQDCGLQALRLND